MSYADLLLSFVQPANAQAASGAGPAGGGDLLTSMLPLLLVFGVFYVLIIRPQQNKLKLHRAMLAALRRGDRVLTAGGIIATVKHLDGETEVEAEIASGVVVRLARNTIVEVLSKPEPADKKAAKPAAGTKTTKAAKAAVKPVVVAGDSFEKESVENETEETPTKTSKKAAS
jgi:preprotein translocase subunit YajC